MRDLGHDVFSLGACFLKGVDGDFRPGLDLGVVNAELRAQFWGLGCRLGPGPIHLTAEWVALFDVCIVMHDVDLLARLWPQISVRPVFLRLIGQMVPDLEKKAAPFRALGLRVIRYSPAEMLADEYVHGDAMIRFAKYSSDYGPRTGGDNRLLTFCSNFSKRFADEFTRYRRVTEGLDPALGGAGNDGTGMEIGLVPPETQRSLLCRCAAYLYCSGGYIPYTLTFIEAWMSGIPMVVLDQGVERHRFFEIPHLINPEVDGYVCEDDAEARAVIQTLQEDHELGARVGAAGRASAINLFGAETIGPQWQALLTEAVKPR